VVDKQGIIRPADVNAETQITQFVRGLPKLSGSCGC
jgi:hypothetical protein